MDAPLVAVVGSRLAIRGRGGRVRHRIGVPASYVDALRRAGAASAILAPGDAVSSGHLGRFDALMLVGGGDVEPGLYGGIGHAEISGVDPDRDRLEIALLRAADRAKVPTLAICRGAQVMNVAFGGTLVPHVPDVAGAVPHGTRTSRSAWHDVEVSAGSRLADACGEPPLRCASRHHQGLDRMGPGLVAVAWSPDGLVEAVERDGGWMLGVQWHPETTAAEDARQQSLFDTLVREARRRSGHG